MDSYSITNIKAFKEHTEITIKPITIFVGRNSCGKSSLMRFPVVLAQTADTNTSSPLKFYGKLIDYGYYDDVVFCHSKDPMEFSFEYRMDIGSERIGRMVRSNDEKRDIRSVVVRVSLKKQRRKIVIEKNELLIDGSLCYGLYRESSDIYRTRIYQSYKRDTCDFDLCDYEIFIKNCKPEQFFVSIDERDISDAIKKKYFQGKLSEYENTIKTPDGNEWSFETIVRMPEEMRKRFIKHYNKSIPDDGIVEEFTRIYHEFEYYSALLGEVNRWYIYESERLSYIGPFRQNPERVYRDEEFQSRRVGVKGENVTTLLIRDYQKKSLLISSISNWLKRTMGYSLVVDRISNGLYQLMLEDENGIRSNIIDVGYGVSQILPIVTQILIDPPQRRVFFDYPIDNIVIVEQPELHLHPAAQSELAELLVDGAIHGKKKLLVETHSEHLIRKLQVLIANPKCGLTNEDVAIYYVDKDSDGKAFVDRIGILPNGQFEKEWPEGFFDKAFTLSMELMEVSIPEV